MSLRVGERTLLSSRLSVRTSHGSESAATQSAMRSEMEELRSSHAAAVEAARASAEKAAADEEVARQRLLRRAMSRISSMLISVAYRRRADSVEHSRTMFITSTLFS